MSQYTAFTVELVDKIAHVQINRPEKINSMNAAFWSEIVEIIQWVDDTDEVRVVVLSGAGKHFSSGIDLIAACDMRYAAEDAQFSIKEIDIGMAADVGTLQRLPRIIGDGMLRELAYTGRTFGAEEARGMGLVNRVYSDTASLLDGVMGIAREIASKSPIAVTGTKEMISYMRDHRIDDGLEYVATWNAAMLQSTDLRVAMAAHMSKQKPEFLD
jgi:enoyl-CoA hydratase